MVGGGVLIKTLIGIDYEISVIGVGILMLSYVVFGGMKATTWVQIVKAVLLVIASILLVAVRLGALRLQPAGLPRRRWWATRRCRVTSPSCWATPPPT